MSGLRRLAPAARSPLWDHAYGALRATLMAGRLAPGERILLRDVAEQLGISLTPVRDAVNRLVAERVLERGGVGQGGGATVPVFDADQFAPADGGARQSGAGCHARGTAARGD